VTNGGVKEQCPAMAEVPIISLWRLLCRNDICWSWYHQGGRSTSHDKNLLHVGISVEGFYGGNND